MRALAALCLLLAATPALSAKTYEIRSALHAVTVDVEGKDETREYAVRVSDLQTGTLLVTERLSAAKRQARVDTNTNLSILVHAGELNGTLTISMTARNNGVTVDSMSANFLIEPFPGIINPSIAPPPPAVIPPPRDPSPAMQGVHRVGGDVQAPTVTHHVEPTYPDAALKAGVSGVVIIEALINEQGVVQNARVIKPLPFGLDETALEAVRQWKFRPGTLHGQPVKVLFNLTIRFNLPEVHP